MNVGVVVIIFLLVLSFLGVPIFIALGIGTLVALHMADMALIVLPQKLFAGMNSSSLLAIPFFILAGSLMSRSITEKLINIANALIGQIKGSLGVVTVLSSTLFGAISGSGVATASAIGGITIIFEFRHQRCNVAMLSYNSWSKYNISYGKKQAFYC